MVAGDQQLINTPFVPSGYWSPCELLVSAPLSYSTLPLITVRGVRRKSSNLHNISLNLQKTFSNAPEPGWYDNISMYYNNKTEQNFNLMCTKLYGIVTDSKTNSQGGNMVNIINNLNSYGIVSLEYSD
ncbi:unnamed protein product [Schistosoma mattheei]|uniref:Uncharacterized protein n=1 Tax=Schistosoma mattheei TaxID=31246 RepID=A0A183PZF5_9TREM|nr:unnamed protein product [Schistosoma mattheei]